MDAIVEKALAKWPKVPHCYGWLALDARGNWRMRNEHAQEHHLAGDKILQAGLRDFINRNYTCDEQGNWYFQNGPQRVYVALEVAPYIAHTDPNYGFVLQTGAQLSEMNAIWLSDQGRLFLQGDSKFAMLDDRDLAQCLAELRLNDEDVKDEELLKWLERRGANGALYLQRGDKKITINYIEEAAISTQFKFILTPQAKV